ncbi:hypothetical protein BGZ54_009231 [Gamsiella multidivaricata]|nr:hypothetical protein BGZ54_009231 [Gamsiella multidivaricata]
MSVPSAQQGAVTLGTVLLLLSTATLLLYALQHPPTNPHIDHTASPAYIVQAHHTSTRPLNDPPSFDANQYNLGDGVSIAMKEPATPPDSLPSDPYAQYIYHKELQLNGDHGMQPKIRRTIVVGDIHGSLQGFNTFLKKVDYDRNKDVLILAGDLVAKGPHSLQVIDRARELDAKCVRGNHDDKVIRWRGYLDSLSSREQSVLEAEEDDETEEDQGNWGLEDDWTVRKRRRTRRPRSSIPSDLDRKSEHYRLARTMTKAQYDYLRNCPLIFTLPKELSIHNIPVHVVHAGIDPHRGILKQKPWVLINVRNLLKDGTPTRKKKSGRGWAKEFNEMHNRRSPSKRDFLVGMDMMQDAHSM